MWSGHHHVDALVGGLQLHCEQRAKPPGRESGVQARREWPVEGRAMCGGASVTTCYRELPPSAH